MKPPVTTLNAALAETAWFDPSTGSALTMSAEPESFDSPLTVSPSKGERPAQNRPGEGYVFCGFRFDHLRGLPWNV